MNSYRSMIPVHQTDFSPGGGNALQACVASLFSLPLEAVPNFISAPDYRAALNHWLQERNLSFLKIELKQGVLHFAPPGTECILAGASPRGNFRHAVLGRTLASDRFEIIFDPHPDQTGLAGAPLWVGFFTKLKLSRTPEAE